MEVKNMKINELDNQQLQTQGELQTLSEEELQGVVGGGAWGTIGKYLVADGVVNKLLG